MPSAELHQIIYRWTSHCPFDPAAGLDFWPVSWSFEAPAALRLWHDRVLPWLRTNPGGAPEPSLFYSVFDSDAVLLRREQRPSVSNATAHLLIAPREMLTPKHALELSSWSWADDLPAHVLRPDQLAAYRTGPDLTADRDGAVHQLIPVLSEVLAEPGTVVAPAGRHTPSVLWMLDEILSALSTGLPSSARHAFSFETFDDQAEPHDRPGLFFRFRPGVTQPAVSARYGAVAMQLIKAYGDGSVNGLRAMLNQNRILEGRTPAARVDLMTKLWAPDSQPSASGATMNPPAAPAPASVATYISCPICLERLTWDDLEYHRFDLDQGEYVKIDPSRGTNPEQRAREMRNTFVRCPNPGGTAGEHYLPANYGRYGPPAVFGFIGASNSGKSHLLAAMVGALEQGGLGPYGLAAQPIDLARHQRYMRDTVRPLLTQSRRIIPTQENIVQFVDGFIISGKEDTRPMAMFDVAGSELMEVEDAKSFLDLADGLIFVVDPDLWDQNTLDDVTFSTVLNLLRESGRLSKVSAAVVLGKADLLKFEDPIALWLRHDAEPLSSAEVLDESADVYAYLHQRRARAWARPYDECSRATLHVASALGSDSFERGVQPQRVLRPLVSLMAMTGILSAPEVANLGI